ncbi:MAG: LTA synthase family protein [Tissierellia bacterium]|nr:LTA synthase family protein [Tissierellia bacterium]
MIHGLISAFITLVMFALTPGGPLSTLKLGRFPLVFALNFAPIFIFSVLLEGLLGRIRPAIIVNAVFYMGLFVIHRTKVMYRNAPFVFSDFKLGLEGANMLKQSYYPDRYALIILGGGLLFTVLAAKFLKKPKIKFRQRLWMVLAALMAAALLFGSVYVQDRLYYSLPVAGNPYNILSHFNSKGFNYTFLYRIKDVFVKAPQDYDREEIQKYDEEDRSQELATLRNREKPNIIWIMGEAFTDLSQNSAFSFEPGFDPNENFKRLQGTSILSGRIVTPSFGGGTGDTEFDVLTGTLTTDVSINGYESFNAIKREIDSLPRFLDDIGYQTRAFHPGYEWFYRRNEVYGKMGFQEMYFLEDIENPEIRGEYVSEKQFTDLLIERFEADLEKSEAPLFDYAVDIQNHGPYTYDKYQESYPYHSKYKLSHDAANMFGSYFMGVKDIDRMLGRVYEMMMSKREPIVLVFYGDHLPSLGSEPSAYEEIKKELSWEDLEGEIEYYSTPFMVLANESGRAYLQRENTELNHGAVISSNYLASTVLDLLGYTQGDPFFGYNSELRKKLPVISRHFIYDGKDAYHRTEGDTESPEIYHHYRKYEYYRIND